MSSKYESGEPMVFLVLEGRTQSTLLPGGDVAASVDAAMRKADERAGRFAAHAGPWEQFNHPVGFEYGAYRREVPNVGWQFIEPVKLHGASEVVVELPGIDTPA